MGHITLGLDHCAAVEVAAVEVAAVDDPSGGFVIDSGSAADDHMSRSVPCQLVKEHHNGPITGFQKWVLLKLDSPSDLLQRALKGGHVSSVVLARQATMSRKKYESSADQTLRYSGFDVNTVSRRQEWQEQADFKVDKPKTVNMR
ncbi:hypothetical protein N7463_005065 [Penicillium fimorum]|uniref:Uncharacterized protein n=1 Tax=Penicillium fimorum TaxID=1882269 RepID=A0A9X0C599_9EURO|nr:hypothetical protein N7463_005065 [Penicillium fimorum]